jgi:F0F1-type ATP synthase membrane subunit b/b'
MEIFDRILKFFAEQGIGLNTDILETGVINIIALIVIALLQFGGEAKGALETRKNTITESVEGAENRLKEAEKRLVEAEKQLRQVAFVVVQIRVEARYGQRELVQYYGSQAKKDQAASVKRALATYLSNERQIVLELKQKILEVLLNRIVTRTLEAFKSEKRSVLYTDTIINELKGDLS